MRTPQNDREHLSRLQDYYARHRSIPAYERLCALWGIASRSAAGKVLERFCRQGWVERTPDNDWVPCRPFFARSLAAQPVQAGSPAADLQAGLTLTLLDELLVDTPSRTLLLTVQGESMAGANIFSGDVVVVELQEQANSGEIVVALIDGELTVKRLIREDNGWLLHPENPAFSDIRPQGELRLIGVVTGLARRLKRGGR